LTPNISSCDKEKKELTCKDLIEPPRDVDTKFTRILIVSAAITFALLLVQYKINCLAEEIQNLKIKVSEVEHQNFQLKVELELVRQSLQLGVEIQSESPTKDMKQPMESSNSDKFDKPKVEKPPKTRKVWLGDPNYDEVEILDKSEKILPDYCYFTVSSYSSIIELMVIKNQNSY
jgi:regulator of replication initiation timing